MVRLRGLRLCFPHCFEGELRRLMDHAAPTHARPRPRRIPLGLILLSRGSIDASQLQHALDAQTSAACGRIGEWLRRLGFAEEFDVAAALASQWSCPLLRKLPLQDAHCDIPAYLLRSFRMLPVFFSNSKRTLHLAFAGEIPYQTLLAIEEIADYKTEVCVTTETELERGFERLGENVRGKEKSFENCRGAEEVVRIVSSYAARLAATEVRVARCGEFLWARILNESDAMDLFFHSGITAAAS